MVLLTSSRRLDRQDRKRTGGAGVVFLPATAAIFLGYAARRRNLAEARREHLPRRDVVVTRPRIDAAVSVSVSVPTRSPFRSRGREDGDLARF